MCHTKRTQNSIVQYLLNCLIRDSLDSVAKELKCFVAVHWDGAGKVDWLSLVEIIIKELYICSVRSARSKYKSTGKVRPYRYGCKDVDSYNQESD